jgi:hypothetical protein
VRSEGREGDIARDSGWSSERTRSSSGRALLGFERTPTKRRPRPRRLAGLDVRALSRSLSLSLIDPSPLSLSHTSHSCPRRCRCPVGISSRRARPHEQDWRLTRSSTYTGPATVIIKHAGTSHELTVDLAQPGRALKQQIYEATGVPIDRCVLLLSFSLQQASWGDVAMLESSLRLRSRLDRDGHHQAATSRATICMASGGAAQLLTVVPSLYHY